MLLQDLFFKAQGGGMGRGYILFPASGCFHYPEYMVLVVVGFEVCDITHLPGLP